MGLKNIWSLPVDELLVADRIQDLKDKRRRIFYPLSSALKDIDLLYVNLDTYKTVSIQVKGSRTYEPQKSEKKRYGIGSSSWFILTKEALYKPLNKVDYYIFVLHNFKDGKVKREIGIDYLIIPSKDMQSFCKKKKTRNDGKRYDFFIWIDANEKRSFDFENGKGGEIALSKYLNNWNLLKV
jgi:hypothetical protein